MNKIFDNGNEYIVSAADVIRNYYDHNNVPRPLAEDIDTIDKNMGAFSTDIDSQIIPKLYIKNIHMLSDDGDDVKIYTRDLYQETIPNKIIENIEQNNDPFYFQAADRLKRKMTCDIYMVGGSINFIEKNVTMNAQGDASLSNAKHNWKIKFKNKKEFKNWPAMKTFVLKADMEESGHIRNWVASDLWRQMQKTDSNIDILKENNFDTYPKAFSDTVTQGAIDSFVVQVYITDSDTSFTTNTEYQGLYSFIFPKSDKMMGIDEDKESDIKKASIETAWSMFGLDSAGKSTKYAMRDWYMGYSKTTNGDQYVKRTLGMRDYWKKINNQPYGSFINEGYQFEAGGELNDFITEEIIEEKVNSWNQVMECVLDDTKHGYIWAEAINEKLDLKSMVDWYLLTYCTNNTDSYGKNMLWWTHDYTYETDKWHAAAYDLANTFGINRDLTKPLDYMAIWANCAENLFYERLWNETNLISDRYHELRNAGILDSQNINKLFADKYYIHYQQCLLDKYEGECVFDGKHKHEVSDVNNKITTITLPDRTSTALLGLDQFYNNSYITGTLDKKFAMVDTFFENGTMNHKYALLSKIDLKKEKFIIPYETNIINLYDYVNIEPYYFNNVDNNLYNVSATCNDTAVTINTKVVDGDKYKITANVSKATKSLLEFKISNNEFALFAADKPANAACNGQVRLFTPILIQRSQKPTVFTKTNIIYTGLNYFDLDYETNVDTANLFNTKIELNGVDITSEFETDGVNRYVIPDKYTSDTSFDITVTVAMEGLDLSDTQTKVMKYDTVIGRPIMRIGTGWGVFVDTDVYSDDYNDGKITVVGHLEKMAAYYGAGFYNGNFWFFGAGVSRIVSEIGMDYRDTQNATRVVFRANYTKEKLLSFTVGKANATHKLLLEYFVNKSGKVTDMITGVSSTASLAAADRSIFDNNVASLYLYDCNRGGSSLQKKYGINYIYQFTVENSTGAIVRDLMPVFYNGNPCFYDIISKQHFVVNSSEADPSYQIKYTTYSGDTYVFLDKTGESILQ